METSEALVERAQGKDADAFAALIGQYERTALALAYSVTGNATVASDVVQDAFLRAWQRIGDLEDRSRFGGWLCRIVRNLSMDAIRRGPRPAEPLEDNLALPAQPRDGGDPESEMNRRETSQRVGQALDVLDELTRSAVVLRYYEDLSSKQIGELLELSPAAVDMRLSRARAQLREILSDAGDSLTGAGGHMEYGAA